MGSSSYNRWLNTIFRKEALDGGPEARLSEGGWHRLLPSEYMRWKFRQTTPEWKADVDNLIETLSQISPHEYESIGRKIRTLDPRFNGIKGTRKMNRDWYDIKARKLVVVYPCGRRKEYPQYF